MHAGEINYVLQHMQDQADYQLKHSINSHHKSLNVTAVFFLMLFRVA